MKTYIKPQIRIAMLEEEDSMLTETSMIIGDTPVNGNEALSKSQTWDEEED